MVVCVWRRTRLLQARLQRRAKSAKQGKRQVRRVPPRNSQCDVSTFRRSSDLHAGQGRFSGAILAEARALLKAELSASLESAHLFEPLARLSVDHSGPVGDDDELHSVARAEFHQDPGDVRLGGEWAEVKLLSDFGVGQAGRDEAEDFPLAARKLVQPVVVGLGCGLRPL